MIAAKSQERSDMRAARDIRGKVYGPGLTAATTDGHARRAARRASGRAATKAKSDAASGRRRAASARAGDGERTLVKSLGPDDRPREKLARLGADGLGDNELTAIILGQGFRRQNALDLANALLAALGGIHGLTRVSAPDLQRVRGIGPVRAMQLLAAVELGRRTLMRPNQQREQILSPKDAAAYLTPRFSARGIEQFGLMLLDVRYRVIRAVLLSSGGVDSAPVQPRDVFREATAGRASAVVLFHNHPSGDPSPSQDDIVLTARMLRAGDVMGIDVVDHVILADNRYYSFRETGGLTAARATVPRD
jgi:DNA repair protein RadC